MENLDHPFLYFNDAKMVALGERRLIVPFYHVQDCGFDNVKY